MVKINSTLRNFLHSYVNKEKTWIQDIELFLSILQLKDFCNRSWPIFTLKCSYKLPPLIYVEERLTLLTLELLAQIHEPGETEGYNIERFHCFLSTRIAATDHSNP